MTSIIHKSGSVICAAFIAAGFLVTATVTAQPQQTSAKAIPTTPFGYDAYRQWYKWPMQRLGTRAYMRSTFDRIGRNEGADASHFLYQETDDFNVTLDTLGPGCLYFARYNHWHGSPWHYEVDKRDFVVRESSTADPDHPVENSVFIPEKLFPNPLTYTWSVTKGADLNWVPMPFENSFRMAYGRTHYGTGYYIYHKIMLGVPLSKPLESWTPESIPPDDVLNLLDHAGSDMTELLPADIRSRLTTTVALLDLTPYKTTIEFPDGANTVYALRFSVPREHAEAFGRANLRITWDEKEHASVDAPINLFFGAGTLYNREDAEYLVRALPMNIRFDDTETTDARVHLACYFPMPYFESAQMDITGATTETLKNIRWELVTAPFKGNPDTVGYFHATYVDHTAPVPGKSLVLLDTKEVEGGGDWSGTFVGTTYIFSHNVGLYTLEGDPRFFFDGSKTPQGQGTGSEEWGGGGDYWGGRTMTLPLAGHPVGARTREEAKNELDLIHSAYRFLLADLMPFGNRAVITLEHGAENDSKEHYETVTYWYGVNSPSLVQTDHIDIGDLANEQAHNYAAPGASEPVNVTSRYEWGPDWLHGKEVFPTHTETGRRTTGTTEFTMALDPDNLGVLLRRTLDYAYPNQRAEVYVLGETSDTKDKNDINDTNDPDGNWQHAGTWYLAGGTLGVYSNPPEETGETRHVAQISNRRFKDDEFLIPRALTKNRGSIRLRLVFDPISRPVYPGYPKQETAWADFGYTAFCYQMPNLKE